MLVIVTFNILVLSYSYHRHHHHRYSNSIIIRSSRNIRHTTPTSNTHLFLSKDDIVSSSSSSSSSSSTINRRLVDNNDTFSSSFDGIDSIVYNQPNKHSSKYYFIPLGLDKSSSSENVWKWWQNKKKSQNALDSALAREDSNVGTYFDDYKPYLAVDKADILEVTSSSIIINIIIIIIIVNIIIIIRLIWTSSMLSTKVILT